MADATILPNLTHFKWSTTSASRPTLLAGVTATATTLTFTSAPTDEDGSVITNDFLIGIKKISGSSRGYVELVYIPANGLSADGLTATGCIRGIEPSGLDYNTANTTYSIKHDAGEPVFCAVAAVEAEMIVATLQGTIATGGASFKVGRGVAENITVFFDNGDANSSFIRKNNSSGDIELSADGTSTFVPGAATGSITGGDGITVTAGDIDIDLTDTVIFVQTSSGAGDSGKVIRVEADGFLDLDFAGTTADLTAAKLDTLIDGSNADTLHTHANPSISFIATETIAADDAVALLPVEVEFFSQLTDANLALSDNAIRGQYAIKIVPTATTSSLTTMLFRAAEAVNGATDIDDLIITIQGDSAGAPDGTPIANGTANTITDATMQGWNITQSNRTATWASSPTLTAGTTYWIVFTPGKVNAVNYINLSVNSSHDEDYVTFTRLTYDNGGPSWGNSATNATPFFWFNTEIKLLGMGLVPTDSNFGGRTWSFIGFAKSGVAAAASTGVYFDYVPDLASLVPGEEYWLSGTPGAITLTKPNGLYGQDFPYRVGKALTTTDLLVKTGVKRIMISAASVTATTATNYVLWFKPSYIRASASGDAGNASSHSTGFFDGTNNYSINQSEGPSGTWTEQLKTNASLYLEDPAGGPDTQSGVASALTDAGFTYTVTEAGVVTLHYFLEVTDS